MVERLRCMTSSGDLVPAMAAVVSSPASAAFKRRYTSGGKV